jgi:hypothetical protein
VTVVTAASASYGGPEGPTPATSIQA